MFAPKAARRLSITHPQSSRVSLCSPTQFIRALLLLAIRSFFFPPHCLLPLPAMYDVQHSQGTAPQPGASRLLILSAGAGALPVGLVSGSHLVARRWRTRSDMICIWLLLLSVRDGWCVCASVCVFFISSYRCPAVSSRQEAILNICLGLAEGSVSGLLTSEPARRLSPSLSPPFLLLLFRHRSGPFALDTVSPFLIAPGTLTRLFSFSPSSRRPAALVSQTLPSAWYADGHGRVVCPVRLSVMYYSDPIQTGFPLPLSD